MDTFRFTTCLEDLIIVPTILHTIVCVPLTAIQVQRLSLHQLNPSTSRRHSNLHLCLSLLNIQQEIPKSVQRVHEVFALDARYCV